MDWRIGSFRCMYTCSGYCTRSELKEDACFSYVTGSIPPHTNKTIDYKIWVALFDKGSCSNFCTPEEIKYVLNKLREIVPFKFKLDFTPHMYQNKPYGIIELHVTGVRLAHKIILTYTRCFFEYPYNVVARETLNVYPEVIKRMRVGNSISWLNVFLTIESCFTSRGGGHTWTCPYKPDAPLFTKEGIIQRIKENPDMSLNSLFGYGNERLSHVDYKPPRNEMQLQDEEATEKRIQQYVTLLKEKLTWIK